MAPLKSYGMVSSSHILIRMSWEERKVPRPADLKSSAGFPSMPAAWPEFIWPTAFLTSSRVGSWSSPTRIRFCGIMSRASESTTEGLLSRLEKCFPTSNR